MSPKFLFKKALNLKLSPKFLFEIFFYKILKELTKNDHKSLNHIQIHNLGHFLGKNIPWLNLVLVLLLKWSIVLCLDYNTTAHLLAYKVCSVIFFASLLLYQDGLITLPNNKSFQHHFYLSIKANDATITGFICHIKISMKEIKVRVLPPLTEFSVA